MAPARPGGCILGRCQSEPCEGLRASQEMNVMKSKAEKLLVVESGDALREHIVAVLSDAGYEVSTDYRDGMKSILAFHPDAVVLGANPPQLDCCDLLSQIKGSEHTQYIRVDRKSTRLNSSHGYISYAVFCLKKKKDTLPSRTC